MVTGTRMQTHHPYIARLLAVLGQTAPAPTARAGAALHRLLWEVYESPLPEFAWHTSDLTGDGFPLEFTFTSADAAVRYTAEVAAPTLAAEARRAIALALVARLGGQAIPLKVANTLQALQAGATASKGLHFGAWVGGRHTGLSAASDRFKLYLEVPESKGRLPFPPSLPKPVPHLSDRQLQLRIYGYEPTTGTHECYYRVVHMMSYHVYHLLRQVELGHRTRELLNLIQEAYSRPLRDKLPGGSAGLSFSYGPGRPVVFTLFLFARALWGGDCHILQRLTTLAAARSWKLGAYRQAAAPLAARNVYQTYHGLLGFVVASDAPIQVTIGLRPPPLREGV